MYLLLLSAAALCILVLWLFSSTKAKYSDYLLEILLSPYTSLKFGPKLSRTDLLREHLLDWKYDIKKRSMNKYRLLRIRLRALREKLNSGYRKNDDPIRHYFFVPFLGSRLWDKRITDVGSFGCYFVSDHVEPESLVPQKWKGPHLRLEGMLRLPKQVYEGDSFIISMTLDPVAHTNKKSDEPSIIIRTREDGVMSVAATWPSDIKSGILHVKLVCAGIEIVPARPEEQRLNLERLVYRWSCACPNSGEHELSLEFSFNESFAFLSKQFDHRVRVVRVDHLTKRQVWVLAALGGVVSFLLSVATIIGSLI